MKNAYTRQPPRGAKVAGGAPLGRGITGHFLFNGDFRSAVRGKTGAPIASGGPKIVSAPSGQYALGNGSGKVTTNLYAADLGMAGSAPRSFVVDFDLPDSATMRNVFSFGDTGTQTRSMNALQISPGTYRTVRFDTYGNDTQYTLHNVGGTATRVFLMVSIQGTTIIFRSYSYLYSTGQVIYNSQTSTLGGALVTGNTAPLNLMGGGAYNFTPLASALYHLSMYGGRVLTSAEFDQLYADRHQVMAAPRGFPYAAIATLADVPVVATPSGVSASVQIGSATVAGGARTAPIGVGVSVAVGAAVVAGGARAMPAGIASLGQVGSPSTSGVGGTAPAGVMAIAQVGAVTAIGGSASLAMPAGVSAAGSVGQPVGAGGARAAPQGVSAFATAGSVAGTAGLGAAATPAGIGAVARAGAATGSGGALCSPSGVVAFTLVGAAVAAGNIGVPGSSRPIDISKISLARIVVFDGSGSRVVIFEGSGKRLRFENMSAKKPEKDGDKWVTERDPNEESYYAADITDELSDRFTTVADGDDSVEIIVLGVEQLEAHSVEVVAIDGVERTFVVVFLGGLEGDPPDDWHWTARVRCANRERFDKTTWFKRVDT